VASVLEALGCLETYTRRFNEAERAFERALRVAPEDLSAALHNDIGNLRAFQQQYADAEKEYALASKAARARSDISGEARALANAALAGIRGGSVADGLRHARLARTSADKLAATSEKAGTLLTIGRAFELAVAGPKADPKLLREAFDACAAAQTAAETAGDRLAMSYALGTQGHLYELDGQTDAALQLTRRAAFLAQEVRSPHALYRLQWQTGRLLAAQGQLEPAIASYTLATATLAPIQNDLTLGYGTQGPTASFRDAVAPVYYELADLLLRRADAAGTPDDAERLVREARQTVELLKTGELQDFFQDPCVNLLKSRAKSVEAVGDRTAVVYLIPLKDRTELIVARGSHLVRVKSPVTSERLVQEVREFRTRLEDRTTNRYLRNARTLYNWLIRPIEQVLAEGRVDTLVFVPDGALRTIPMAALNDGTSPLIEKYATAVTLNLSLIDPKPVPRTQAAVLRAGLSQAKPPFPALAYVPAELQAVGQSFGGVELLDKQFTKPNLTAQLRDNDFSIVHVASHAQFSGDIGQTFLLTDDGQLKLGELERMINGKKFRDRPLELLALSACQTAAGDDRAALGLAGVAVKAGARSAVATLWSVNDEASATLVSGFYAELKKDPTLSKAQAMRRAQRALLADDRYRHAYYWSPFLVIGNWL
jgi:CHAT domain-containing protein